MYVPGARSEREMTIELAFMPNIDDWEKWVELFRKPLILFESFGGYERNVHLFSYEGNWVLRKYGKLIVIDGKKIKELDMDINIVANNGNECKVEVIEGLEFPVKIEEAIPEEKVLKQMEDKIKLLEEEKKQLRAKVKTLKGLEYHKAMHRIYSIEREVLELQLSIELNKLKIGGSSREKIREIGKKLNEARRKRRTYDYVLEFYESRERYDRKN